MLLLVVAVAQTPDGLTEAFLRVGSKKPQVVLARGARCSASALRASSATVTAGEAQVLADGFVQQPPSAAVALTSGGQSLMLSRRGKPILRYSVLTVTDARAHAARLVGLRAGRLLRVDTHGARFPALIDSRAQSSPAAASWCQLPARRHAIGRSR